MRYFRKGGLTFLQVGQLTLMWCVSHKREPFWTYSRVSALFTTLLTIEGAALSILIRNMV